MKSKLNNCIFVSTLKTFPISRASWNHKKREVQITFTLTESLVKVLI